MSQEEPESVLELRIHGVNNTPPHALLDLPEDEVVLSFGDDLGSFWHPTPEAVARTRADEPQGETSRGVVDPAEPPRGRVPAGIHREAYSWGGMVRTTTARAGVGGMVVAAVARAAWTLVLPFSIANAAIWSWSLPSPASGTRIRYGSGLIRLACLALTLVFVLSFASVAIDLIALQCYRGGATICPPLSDVAGMFARWQDERRVALFSLVPVVALLVVFLVSTIATLRYNVAGRILAIDGGDPERPLLAEPRFWQTRRETHRLAMLHLAAGFATVALLLSFAFGDLSPVTAALLTGAAVAVIAAAGALTVSTDSTPYERTGGSSRAPAIVLGLAVALYAVPALVLGFHGHVRLHPTAIGRNADQVLVSVVVGALVLVALAWLLPAPRRTERAWGGRAPAVFLTLGLTISLILGSLVNVLVGDWLNGAAGANRLDEPYTACVGSACRPRQITLGTFYAPFLGITLAAVIVAVAILAVMALRRRDVGDRLPPSSAAPADTPRGALAALLGTEVARKRAMAARLHLVEPIAGVLAVAFFVAILLTLARPFAEGTLSRLPDGLGAFFGGLFGAGLARWIDASLGVWAVISAAILAGLVFGGHKSTRPLALVWDLACFLPRAGHPFGAPCYTERAVPEVARRLAWWLDLPPAAPGAPPRTAIVSAHSMGAVVALSALFALRGDRNWETSYRDRVALLTFGVQLRPYFGRFFPEILGPDVIDSIPCAKPRVWARDPWAGSDLERIGATVGADANPIPETASAPTAAPPGAARPAARVPARAWINLWRLTDHLGFPARSAAASGNERDRYAEEIDVGGYVGAVDSHSWYPRTPAYRRALEDLRAAIATPVAAPGPTPTLPTPAPAPPGAPGVDPA
ncbi:hypothetical protein EDM22_16515 [Agromyces tardus]|uniref:Integral membrane protein n=1 Tax=Agromyces tardus TaxID=2583849 RepID=A0A3M8A2F6_9MICO|nr:hypothetical protein [Agromyces tardus]RNB45272.1 hypothetical protein EDM22_16515 [Agromyces tardus]